MARRNRRRQADIDIATANADLRFGPEQSGLQALMGQAHEDYKTDLRSANADARTVIQGARAARPLLRRIYNQAAGGVKAAQSDIEAAFNQAGVTPDNAFRLASESEGTAYRQKMTAEAAHARRETVKQVQEARLGRVFARGAARDRYNSTISQLNQRASDLLGERQSFLTSELGRMQDERANRRNQRAVAQIQQGIDPKTGLPIPGGPADEDPKRASRDDLTQFTTAFARAVRRANDSFSAGDDRDIAENQLLEGRPARTVGDVSLPAKAKIGDKLAVQAALEMAYRGSISAKTRRRMLDMGLFVTDLDGARFIRDKHKRRRVAASKQSEFARIIGQDIPGVGQVLGI